MSIEKMSVSKIEIRKVIVLNPGPSQTQPYPIKKLPLKKLPLKITIAYSFSWMNMNTNICIQMRFVVSNFVHYNLMD